MNIGPEIAKNPDGTYHMRVSSIAFYPWVKILGKTDKGFVIGGALKGMMGILGQSLNFTFEIVFPDDMQFGELVNGSWSGAAGQIQRKEAEILYPWVQGIIREIGLRPTRTIYFGTTSIITGVGRRDDTNFIGFLSTFDVEIWYCIFGLLFATILISSVSDNLLRFKEIRRGGLSREFNYYFWMFLSALFCEGSFRTPYSRRSQFLLGLWLFSILTFMTAFCGQFKALLMVKTEEKPMLTAEDLANNPHLVPYLPIETVIEELFKTSDNEHYKKVWRHANRLGPGIDGALIRARQVFELQCHQRVKNRKAVLVFVPDVVKSFLQDECHKLAGNRRFVFSESLNSIQMNFGLRTDFTDEFVKIFNDRLVWMVEGSLIQKFIDDGIWKYSLKCEPTEERQEKSLNFSNLLPVFYLLFMVDAFAAFCFFVELLFSSHRRRKKC